MRIVFSGSFFVLFWQLKNKFKLEFNLNVCKSVSCLFNHYFFLWCHSVLVITTISACITQLICNLVVILLKVSCNMTLVKYSCFFALIVFTCVTISDTGDKWQLVVWVISDRLYYELWITLVRINSIQKVYTLTWLYWATTIGIVTNELERCAPCYLHSTHLYCLVIGCRAVTSHWKARQGNRKLFFSFYSQR